MRPCTLIVAVLASGCAKEGEKDTISRQDFRSCRQRLLTFAYERLRKSVAQIGYTSRDSVLAQTVAASGRSGYQWTRKLAQKTVSVSLSQPQFEAMNNAVSNQRKPWKMIARMEIVSRRIIFASTPDTQG